MNVIGRGAVYTPDINNPSQSSAFPGICILKDGSWLCTFRTAPTKNALIGQSVLLTRSTDEGASWTEPIEPFPPMLVEGKPGAIRAFHITELDDNELLAVLGWVDLSNPNLPFFNPDTEGLLDMKILTVRSNNKGETWSEPTLVRTTYPMPTPITGPILKLPNGELACQFELNKTYYDEAPWRHASILAFSSDHGATWNESVVVSNDPENKIFYWDQRPSVMDNGLILNLFWTYDNSTGVYLNIHSRHSTDSGRTWSEMRDIGVPGQPAQAIPLKNGGLLMAYVDRTGAPVIKARASFDGGLTWSDETEIILSEYNEANNSRTKTTMADAWSEMEAFSLGLPAAARTPEGDAVVVYYSGSHSDRTGIRWVKVG